MPIRMQDIVLIATGVIKRTLDTDSLQLFGGTDGTSGANVILYGSSHASLPGVAIFEADKFIVRTVAGGQSYMVFTHDTVANLPAASTAGKGARSFVNDASSPTFGSTVTGGGATAVPVYSDGTNWLVG